MELDINGPRWQWNEDYPEALATALDHAAGLNWRSIGRRRSIVAVSDAAACPNLKQSAPPPQVSAPVPMQTMSSVWVLDPRTNPRRFMRVLLAAGNESFIDATHGEAMLASQLLAKLKG